MRAAPFSLALAATEGKIIGREGIVSSKIISRE